MAQGVEVHGVPVRHGEKQEEEEGEVKQEVEGQEEENAQRRRHMPMDEMKVKRHVRGLEPMCESVNISGSATTDGMQCAQCCIVSSSACVASFTRLFTLRSALLRMCL